MQTIIYGVIEDSAGRIWLATNGGLSCYDGKRCRWTNFFDTKSGESVIVQSVCEDRNGRIWVGTYAHGVYVIDGGTMAVAEHFTSELGVLSNKSYVFSICCDSSGDIWLGGIRGEILRYDQVSGKFDAYTEIAVSQLAELDDQRLLVATANSVITLDKHTKQTATLVAGYAIRDISVVGGRLWIATAGSGLLCYDLTDGTLSVHDTTNGLPSDFVNSLTASADSLWISTPRGIFGFDACNHTLTGNLLPSSFDMVDFTPKAALRLSNGWLAWGTNGGLLLNSCDIKDKEDTGRLFLNDIHIGGQSIRAIEDMRPGEPLDSLRRLKIGYDNGALEFELLSVGSGSNSPLVSYRMAGLEDNWTGPTEINSIRYGNLMPGRYTLQIRLHGDDVVDRRDIEIVVMPPFWRRWWFMLLCMVFLAVVAVVTVRHLLRRIKRKDALQRLRLFVTSAHDLRSSLTLMKAPLEQLSASDHLTDSEKEYLQIASRQVERLSMMTTKMIDIQKISLGKLRFNYSPADVSGLIRSRISMVGALAVENGVDIVFKPLSEKLVTGVDAEKFGQIFDNLLSNAIKYSPSGGKVEVALWHDTERWYVQVSDNGLGIPGQDHKRIFAEFYRGANAVNANVVGSGIGLALTKRLTEAMDGEISFTSKLDVGSTFKLSFPLKEVECVAETTATADDVQDEITVLVCEDNEELRHFLEMSLSKEYRVKAVNCAEDAWKWAKENIPDLILTDIAMEGMDGYELCRSVKHTFATSHIPVILVSALSEQEDQLKGFDAGADNYVCKPFDIRTLKARISTTIRNRRTVYASYIGQPAAGVGNDGQTGGNQLNDKFLDDAIAVLMQHLDDAMFGKEEFAKELNVSPSLLFKKIKALSGCSIVDFIKNVRMQKAHEMMADASLSISDIAFRCGFSSVGYFSTVFKKHFGCTPSEARK